MLYRNVGDLINTAVTFSVTKAVFAQSFQLQLVAAYHLIVDAVIETFLILKSGCSDSIWKGGHNIEQQRQQVVCVPVNCMWTGLKIPRIITK